MSQSPAVNWDSSPTVASEPEPTPVVEVKTESFAELVERKAEEQLLTIKMSTDQTRLNAAVAVRVAELVKDNGLPPPKTEAENIETMTQSKLDEFEMTRLNFLATERAREIFFDRHPEMKTQERKQNSIPDATQAMSQALMESFLRFLRDEHQRDERREHREALRKKPA